MVKMLPFGPEGGSRQLHQKRFLIRFGCIFIEIKNERLRGTLIFK